MGARTRGFANNVLTSGKVDATDGLTGNLASANFANATVTNVEELPPAVGSAISSVAGNPAAPVAEGKIWYNTNTDSFNIAATLEAWSSGAPTITSSNAGGGSGVQTSALVFGGRGPSLAFVSTTEEYNGNGWAVGGALSTARSYIAGFGTQTDAVAAGGRTDAPGTTTNATEEYNGSAWTAGGTMGTARRQLAGAGTQTAGLAFGGGPPAVNAVEEYDGSAWTAGGALPSARQQLGGTGTQTAGLAFGGSPTLNGDTQEYDGSAWAKGGDMISPRLSSTGAGTQTAGLGIGGGSPNVVSLTEEYNKSPNNLYTKTII